MGNNTIGFNIIVFWFFFNISVGVILQLVPSFGFAPLGLEYDPNALVDFTTGANGLQKDVQPNSIIQLAALQIYRVIDMITLGLMQKLVDLGNTYLLGGVNAFKSIYMSFAGGEGAAFGDFFFGVLSTITMFAYGIGAINLFSGKNPIENQY